jgi:hypothetical protein
MNPFHSPWRVLLLIVIAPVVAIAFTAAAYVANPDWLITSNTGGTLVTVSAPQHQLQR